MSDLNSPEVQDNILVKATTFETPCVNLKSVRELSNVCRDRLFSWLSENAPQVVIDLAVSGSALEYAEYEAAGHDGKVSMIENEQLQTTIISALNALGALGWCG